MSTMRTASIRGFGGSRRFSLLREGIDVKFGFIAWHRGIWPADWLCGALGVSRGGFYPISMLVRLGRGEFTL
jgi:hypothetical protein